MQERKYMQRCVGQMQRCILMDVSGVQKQYYYKAYLENASVSSVNGIAMAMDLKFWKKFDSEMLAFKIPKTIVLPV